MYHDFMLFFVVLWCCITRSVSDDLSKCPYGLTTLIHGTEDNFTVTYKNHTFPEGAYERVNQTSFRVCQCSASRCLQKCCSRGEVFVEGECRNATEYNIGSSVIDFDMRFSRRKNVSKFQIIYGNGCPKNLYHRFYPSDYPDANYHLLPDGTLSVSHINGSEYAFRDFCMEEVFHPRNRSFDALVCYPRNDSFNLYEFPLGMVLSVPFLALTLAVYSQRELRNTYGKNLMSHVGSLLTAYSSVIAVEAWKFGIPGSLCSVLGFVRQFSFLSSFSWLNVMCFDVWWSLRRWCEFNSYSKQKENRRYLIYSGFGWGCPAVVVFITAIMQFTPVADTVIKPGISPPSCFLRDGKPFYAYFYGPVIFIFSTDILLFMLSAVTLISFGNKKLINLEDKIHIKNAKTRYFLHLKIFLLMGFNWIIDPFSWISEGSFWTWFLIHFSVTVQAAAIFVIFVCRTEVRNLISSKFCSSGYSNTGISLIDAESVNVNFVDESQTSSC